LSRFRESKVTVKNNHASILEDSELVSHFVTQVLRIDDTPSLIQLVARDANYFFLCSAIVNAESGNNPAFLRSLQAVCRRQVRECSLIFERLIPVARSLGLAVGPVTQLDYYDILGVTTSATTKEIQKAYRKKAYEVHPDTSHSDKEDSQAFVTLHAAYQTLIDASLRQYYDRSRQHRGIWYEHPQTNDEDPSTTKGRHDRIRHFYHLGGIVLGLIAAAFIFHSLYKHNAITDGFYGVRDNDTSKSQVVQSVIPLQKKVKNRPAQSKNHRTVNSSHTKKDNPDLFARHLADSTAKDKHVTVKAHKDEEKPVIHETEPQFDPENTIRVVEKPQAAPPVKEKKHSVQAQKNQLPGPVKSAPPSSGKTTFSPPVQAAGSEKEGSSDSMGESFLQSHGIPANDTPHMPFITNDIKPEAVPESKQQQEDLSFLASISPHSDGYDQQPAPRAHNNGDLKEEALKGNARIPNVSGPEDKVSRMKDFLKTYMKTYESKNIAQFRALFDLDATENGKPFRDQLPKYRRNFEKLQSVTLTIEMYQYTIRIASNMVTTKGTFSLRWRLKGGEWRGKRGDISMDLIESGTSYLIKHLDYR